MQPNEKIANRPSIKILLSIIAVSLVSVGAISRLPAFYIVDAGHDDQLYVRLSRYVLQGEWLGPYDHFTLLKGPFFSIWIAFVHTLGIPLLVAQLGLYLAAGLLAMVIVLPLQQWRWPMVLAYATYAFQPAVYCDQMRRVIRDPLYTSLTILVLAMMLWLIRTQTKGGFYRLIVACLSGFAIAVQYLTREEGVWMAPMIFMVLLFIVLHPIKNNFRKILLEFYVIFAIAISFAAVVGGFMAKNRVTYGVWDIVEFKQSAFLEFFGALARIDSGPQPAFVYISRKSRIMAYEISPTFRQIQEALDGQDGTAQSWAASDAIDFCIHPPDGELRPKVVFALKDAVARCGLSRTAVSARDYWRQAAQEINIAVDSEKIPGKPLRRSLAPPLTATDIKAAIKKMPKAIFSTLRFERIGTSKIVSFGNPHNFKLFQDVVFGPFIAPISSRGQLDQSSQQDEITLWINRIGQIYRWIFPFLFFLALTRWIWCIYTYKKRDFNEKMLVWFGALCLTLIVSRLSLLCYLAVVAMPDPLNPTYNSPTYAVVVIFVCLICSSFYEKIIFHKKIKA